MIARATKTAWMKSEENVEETYPLCSDGGLWGEGIHFLTTSQPSLLLPLFWVFFCFPSFPFAHSKSTRAFFSLPFSSWRWKLLVHPLTEGGCRGCPGIGDRLSEGANDGHAGGCVTTLAYILGAAVLFWVDTHHRQGPSRTP